MIVHSNPDNPYRLLYGISVVARGIFLGSAAAFAVFAAQNAFARPGGHPPQAPASGTFSRGWFTKPQANGQSFQKPNAQNPRIGGSAGDASRPATKSGNTATNAGPQQGGNTIDARQSQAANGNGNVRSSTNGNGNGNVDASKSGNVGAVNTGNFAVGNEVNVDVDASHWGGAAYPGASYAAGVAVGATTSAVATTNALVMGSYYSALPADCASYYLTGYRYYSCAGNWYQQTYRSGSTVYVVVQDPTK